MQLQPEGTINFQGAAMFAHFFFFLHLISSVEVHTEGNVMNGDSRCEVLTRR